MASIDPMRTQCVAPVGIAAELTAAGFEDPEEIGHGGFGVVYRCGQSALGRTVAVKVLTADLEPGNLDRFVREQVAMGKLSGHPHIVNIFQVGSTATGRPYIVMQYHPHGSVEDRIRDDGALGWRDALHIGVKVAGALETAHCRGMLHRDVKPGNILLTEYGEPQLTDFGIARIGGLRNVRRIDHRLTGLHRAGGAAGPAADSGIRRLRPGVDPVHCRHGTRGVRAPPGRADGGAVPAGHQAADAEPVRFGYAGRCLHTHRAGDGAGSRRSPSERCGVRHKLRELQHRHGLPPDDLPVPLPVPGNVRVTPFDRFNAPCGTCRGRPHATRAGHPVPGAGGDADPRGAGPVDRRAARGPAAQAHRHPRPDRVRQEHAGRAVGRRSAPTGVSVAWLCIDHDDNNVVWFLAHLIEAIRAGDTGARHRTRRRCSRSMATRPSATC